MKILMAASEALPYAKTCDRADVTGALPAALKALSHDVRIVMPKYRTIEFRRTRPLKVLEGYPVTIGGVTEYCSIYEGKRDDGVIFYWIENNRCFGREGIYGDRQGLYRDNYLRFSLFAQGALGIIKRKIFTPNVIHVHDWHTSLIPLYLKNTYATETMGRIPVVLTIHDISSRGIVDKQRAPEIGIDPSLLEGDLLDLDGKCSILKGGIVFADHITTHSPSYASEILTPESGAKLADVLKNNKHKLTGISNGIDYSQWDPERDKLIPYSYTRDAMSGKLLNKSNLVKKLGFEVDINIPLMCFISDLVEERGMDILTQVIPDLVEENVQMVIHGKGDRIYEELIKDLARRHPNKIKATGSSDNELAHQIYAASDMILIPSQSEPFAVGQLIALKYGTVPIARATGGLKDTIHEFVPKTGEGNGFLFQKYSALAFLRVTRRALDVFRTGRIWKELVRTCMSFDFSWSVSAQKYAALFEKLLHPQ
jgi:starch synthase